MNKTSLPIWSIVLAGLILAMGCAHMRRERHCPTDARSLYLGCGEEAVRRCPCGIDDAYFGYKPTCWGVWPAGWQACPLDVCPTPVPEPVEVPAAVGGRNER